MLLVNVVYGGMQYLPLSRSQTQKIISAVMYVHTGSSVSATSKFAKMSFDRLLVQRRTV